jgi:hypothetical protein
MRSEDDDLRALELALLKEEESMYDGVLISPSYASSGRQNTEVLEVETSYDDDDGDGGDDGDSGGGVHDDDNMLMI